MFPKKKGQNLEVPPRKDWCGVEAERGNHQGGHHALVVALEVGGALLHGILEESRPPRQAAVEDILVEAHTQEVVANDGEEDDALVEEGILVVDHTQEVVANTLDSNLEVEVHMDPIPALQVEVGKEQGAGHVF